MRIEKYPVNSGNGTMGYWAQIPDNFNGFVNIDLHGDGGQNYGGEATLDQLIVGNPPPHAETPKDLQNGCAANNILLLAPQKFGSYSVDQVNEMVDIAFNKFKATKDGISGFSRGGVAVTGYITSKYSSRISWAISCNGVNAGSAWVNAKNVRAWFFHTQDDNRVGVSNTNNAVASMKAAGGNPKVTIEPTGKHSYNNFYKQQELYNWMKEGVTPTPPIPEPPAPTKFSINAPDTVIGDTLFAEAVNPPGEVHWHLDTVTGTDWSFVYENGSVIGNTKKIIGIAPGEYDIIASSKGVDVKKRIIVKSGTVTPPPPKTEWVFTNSELGESVTLIKVNGAWAIKTGL